MKSSGRIPIIIDTDPGIGMPGSDIDDGLAIAYAVRSPRLEVRALTTVVGNVDVGSGVTNAVRLLRRLGRSDIPVVQGAMRPLVRDMGTVRSAFRRFINEDEPRDEEPALPPTVPMTAAQYLVEQVRREPGVLTVVGIGPATNLALAVALDPAFAGNVAEIVLMAGSATTYAENMTPVGDFNAFVDPEALAVVLGSGARVRMVGLDQTARTRFTLGDAKRLRTSGEACNTWLADCADGWISLLSRAFPNRPEHREACFLHDPLVVASVAEPNNCSWADAYVEVALAEPLTRGLVVADRGLALLAPRGQWNATVAVDSDVEAFHKEFMGVLLAG